MWRMRKRLEKFKPGARKKNIVLLSAVLWSVIGTLLITKGLYRLSQISEGQFLIVASGIVIGSLKSFIVLDKSARRGISRIEELEDGTCLGAVYSKKTWLLVVCMMCLGVFLRGSSIPQDILCFIYVTIGWSLLFSSRLAWLKWIEN